MSTTDTLPPPILDRNSDASLRGEAKARYVSGMFARIAGRYDLMNAVMSFRQDAMWRRVTVRAANVRRGSLTLDVATGTGKIAQELARAGARVVGVDFTLAMMQRGRDSGVVDGGDVYFVGADALALPFADNTFDGVTTGFAMRNVTDIESAFREMYRVVRPGGRVVCLEVGRPRSVLIRSLHAVYTRRIVPLLGRLIAGDSDAYTYLPSSMGKFPPPEGLAAIMRSAGLRNVRWKQLTMAAAAVHTGTKPPLQVAAQGAR